MVLLQGPAGGAVSDERGVHEDSVTLGESQFVAGGSVAVGAVLRLRDGMTNKLPSEILTLQTI